MVTLLADDWLRMVLLDVRLIMDDSNLGWGGLVICEEILHFFNYYMNADLQTRLLSEGSQR